MEQVLSQKSQTFRGFRVLKPQEPRWELPKMRAPYFGVLIIIFRVLY